MFSVFNFQFPSIYNFSRNAVHVLFSHHHIYNPCLLFHTDKYVFLPSWKYFFRRCSFLIFTLLTIFTVLSFVVNSHKITLLTIFTVLSFVVNSHKKSLFLNAFSNVFRFLVLFTL